MSLKYMCTINIFKFTLWEDTNNFFSGRTTNITPPPLYPQWFKTVVTLFWKWSKMDKKLIKKKK